LKKGQEGFLPAAGRSFTARRERLQFAKIEVPGKPCFTRTRSKSRSKIVGELPWERFEVNRKRFGHNLDR